MSSTDSGGEIDFVTTNFPKHLKSRVFQTSISVTETVRKTGKNPHFTEHFWEFGNKF